MRTDSVCINFDPISLLPTPRPPAGASAGACSALIPVAPASDVSFGHTDKSRPEGGELLPGRGLSVGSAAGQKEARPVLALAPVQKLRTLAGKPVQNACKDEA